MCDSTRKHTGWGCDSVAEGRERETEREEREETKEETEEEK
jgi:hypothetical protein